jgi:hypothetical protein
VAVAAGEDAFDEVPAALGRRFGRCCPCEKGNDEDAGQLFHLPSLKSGGGLELSCLELSY